MTEDTDHPQCAEDGCPRRSKSRGYCQTHYVFHWRKGTLPPKPTLYETLDARLDKTTTPGGCWESTMAGDRYPEFWWQGSRYSVHVVACEREHGPPPEPGLYALHHCDNPRCGRGDHLFWGTAQENTADMIAKGRSRPPLGERNGRSKLTADAVRDIRERYASGQVDQQTLADEHGVNRSLISMIVNRRRWAHLP